METLPRNNFQNLHLWVEVEFLFTVCSCSYINDEQLPIQAPTDLQCEYLQRIDYRQPSMDNTLARQLHAAFWSHAHCFSFSSRTGVNPKSRLKESNEKSRTTLESESKSESKRTDYDTDETMCIERWGLSQVCLRGTWPIGVDMRRGGWN